MSRQQRREFLKKSSLILAGAGLSPTKQSLLLSGLAQLFIPSVQAQSATTPVDFVIDIGVRAAYPFCDLFAPPGFLRGDSDPQRGMIFAPNEITQHAASPGRSLWLSPAARSFNGAVGLENFADNIAFIDCGDSPETQHKPIWASRMGGAFLDESGEISSTAGASLGPLFANEVARLRGPNAPFVPGVIMSRGACRESYNGYPTLSPLANVQQLASAFTSRAPLIGRTEMVAVISALNKINKLQETHQMKNRLSDSGVATSGSEQGTKLILEDRGQAITTDYNTLRSDFLVGTGIFNGLGSPLDLGESFLLAFIGFKYNLVGAATIHIDIDHMHLPEEYGTPAAKLRALYLGQRLAALIRELKRTPHPYRSGKMLFDHTFIQLTSEGQRGISFREIASSNLNWDDWERFGCVHIGGTVKGGYLGDIIYSLNGGTRAKIGFDPNSGAVGVNFKPTPSHIYRVAAELATVPDAAIQANMRNRYAAGTIPAMKR
jgi:hypothetical protein